MKRAIPFILLFLAGCAAMKESAERQRFLEQQCSQMASAQNKSAEWLAQCNSGDAHVFVEGLRGSLMAKPANELCFQYLVDYNTPLAEIDSEVIKSRELKCDPIIANHGKNYASSSSISNVCIPWYERKAHPVFLAEIDKYVSEKKLDCVQVVNGIKQERALQAQAASMERQANAASSQAAAMAMQAGAASMQAQSMNAMAASMNRPKTCNRIGSYVTCY